MIIKKNIELNCIKKKKLLEKKKLISKNVDNIANDSLESEFFENKKPQIKISLDSSKEKLTFQEDSEPKRPSIKIPVFIKEETIYENKNNNDIFNHNSNYHSIEKIDKNILSHSNKEIQDENSFEQEIQPASLIKPHTCELIEINEKDEYEDEDFDKENINNVNLNKINKNLQKSIYEMNSQKNLIEENIKKTKNKIKKDDLLKMIINLNEVLFKPYFFYFCNFFLESTNYS